MKHTSLALALICILITMGIVSACQTSVSAPEPTMISTDIPTKESTSTNTQIAQDYPVPSKTPVPTRMKTQIEPTQYIFSTLDLNAIVTVTPSQPGICPLENPDFVLTDEMTELFTNLQTLDYVNLALDEGASFEQITYYAEQIHNENFRDIYHIDFSAIYEEDLTADGVNELIVKNHPNTVVFSCKGSSVVKNLDYSSWWTGGVSIPHISSPVDMNLDNQPEIIVSHSATTGGNTVADILSWNGEAFYSVMEPSKNIYLVNESRLAEGLYWYFGDDAYYWNYKSENAWYYPLQMNCISSISIEDIDNNGTLEMILNDDGPLHYDTLWFHGPWRGQEVTFAWDGNAFVLSDYRIDPGEYRFQALQEADRAFILREYERALQLYDDVINSTTLKPWSPDYMAYLRDVHFAENPDSIANPVMTLDEYQQLSAYARYRVMMIQLAQGRQAEALSTYQLMDQIYTKDNPGFDHAEIGRTYWAAVKDGDDFLEACQVVTEYIGEHRNLLTVLGDSQHGGQSHEYVIEDICPLDETDIALLSGKK